MKATVRTAELRKILEARRQELTDDLQLRVKHVREKAATSVGTEVGDSADSAETDMQDEMAFALMQLKAETLERVSEALKRLDAGTFGTCVECEDDIAERRLRALPFALRCTSCEEEREAHAKRASGSDPRRLPGALFELHQA